MQVEVGGRGASGAEEAVEAWANVDKGPRAPFSHAGPHYRRVVTSPQRFRESPTSGRQVLRHEDRSQTRHEQNMQQRPKRRSSYEGQNVQHPNRRSSFEGVFSKSDAAFQETRAAAVRRLWDDERRQRDNEHAEEKKQLKAECEKLRTSCERNARISASLRQKIAEGKRMAEEHAREMQTLREQLRTETSKRMASEAARRGGEHAASIAKKNEKEMAETIAADSSKIYRLEKRCDMLQIQVHRHEMKEKKVEAKLKAEQKVNHEPRWVRDMRDQLETVQKRRRAKRIAGMSPGYAGWSDGIGLVDGSEINSSPMAVPLVDTPNLAEMRQVIQSQEAYIRELEGHIADLESKIMARTSFGDGQYFESPASLGRKGSLDSVQDNSSERMGDAGDELSQSLHFASRGDSIGLGGGAGTASTTRGMSGGPGGLGRESESGVPWLGSSVRRLLRPSMHGSSGK